MAAGKNKLLRFARLYFGGYDLSGDTRTFATLENSMGEVETAGLSDANGTYLADLVRMVGVKGYQALLNDAAAGAYTLLNSAPKSHVLSVFLGGGAAPALGDMAYLMPALQLSDQTAFSKIGVLQADFALDAASYGANVVNPFGVVLGALTALSNTTTGSAVDNGAATTQGGHANLHITVSSGGTWAFTIQDSADGATGWTTIGTFASNGSAIGGEQLSIAGTIRQYTRFVATRTSGTLTVACALARN